MVCRSWGCRASRSHMSIHSPTTRGGWMARCRFPAVLHGSLAAPLVWTAAVPLFRVSFPTPNLPTARAYSCGGSDWVHAFGGWIMMYMNPRLNLYCCSGSIWCSPALLLQKFVMCLSIIKCLILYLNLFLSCWLLFGRATSSYGDAHVVCLVLHDLY